MRIIDSNASANRLAIGVTKPSGFENHCAWQPLHENILGWWWQYGGNGLP